MATPIRAAAARHGCRRDILISFTGQPTGRAWTGRPSRNRVRSGSASIILARKRHKPTRCWNASAAPPRAPRFGTGYALRLRASAPARLPPGKVFTATSRFSPRCLPRHTTPIPPRPISSKISQSPRIRPIGESSPASSSGTHRGQQDTMVPAGSLAPHWGQRAAVSLASCAFELSAPPPKPDDPLIKTEIVVDFTCYYMHQCGAIL